MNSSSWSPWSPPRPRRQVVRIVDFCPFSHIHHTTHTHTQTTGTRSCLVIFNHPIRNAIVNRWNPLAFKRRGDLLLFSFFNAYIDWSPRFLVSLQSLMNGEYIGVVSLGSITGAHKIRPQGHGGKCQGFRWF